VATDTWATSAIVNDGRGESLCGVHQRLPSALLLVDSTSQYENSHLSCNIPLITIIVSHKTQESTRGAGSATELAGTTAEGRRHAADIDQSMAVVATGGL
jgi:hypothetical protein